MALAPVATKGRVGQGWRRGAVMKGEAPTEAPTEAEATAMVTAAMAPVTWRRA